MSRIFKPILTSGLVVSVVGLAALAAQLGEEIEISWFTVDGGGGDSIGGEFALLSTIGQPDAGAMAGGDFELAGGFWSLPPTSNGCVRNPEWLCDGDVDGDGQVNPVDAGLVQANFCAGETCTDDALCQYDLDCDAQINPVDSGIVQSLFGTCEAPPDVCP